MQALSSLFELVFCLQLAFIETCQMRAYFLGFVCGTRLW